MLWHDVRRLWDDKHQGQLGLCLSLLKNYILYQSEWRVIPQQTYQTVSHFFLKNRDSSFILSLLKTVHTDSLGRHSKRPRKCLTRLCHPEHTFNDCYHNECFCKLFLAKSNVAWFLATILFLCRWWKCLKIKGGFQLIFFRIAFKLSWMIVKVLQVEITASCLSFFFHFWCVNPGEKSEKRTSCGIFNRKLCCLHSHFWDIFCLGRTQMSCQENLAAKKKMCALKCLKQQKIA